MSSITHPTKVPSTSPQNSFRFADSRSEETHWLGEHEERVNTLTHGFGVAISLIAVATTLWIYRRSDLVNLMAFAIYGMTLASVYLFSTLSHAVRTPRARNRMRAWDQGMIYTLITGTYTPFIVRYLDGSMGTMVLIAVWIAAAVGFYSKVLAKHRINTLSTITYLMLGWLPAIPFFGHIPKECAMGMILGGVVYSVGVIFLLLDGRARYFHGVWHLFVMLAGTVHFVTVVRYTLN